MTAFKRVYEDGELFDTKRFSGQDSPNGKSHLGMFLRLTSPLKFNLFIYGLFRTDYIRQAVRYFPDVPSWDRVFMSLVALSARIRSVDEVLHVHGLSRKSLKERYPEEGIFLSTKTERVPFYRILWALTTGILGCHLIPPHRKFYLLLGVPHYIWRYSYEQFKKSVRFRFKMPLGHLIALRDRILGQLTSGRYSRPRRFVLRLGFYAVKVVLGAGKLLKSVLR
jgi:hypothetical protein